MASRAQGLTRECVHRRSGGAHSQVTGNFALQVFNNTKAFCLSNINVSFLQHANSEVEAPANVYIYMLVNHNYADKHWTPEKRN